ncbi:MAG: hypothetical protein ACE5O2_17320, partial [Armatimonadota bacterium]
MRSVAILSLVVCTLGVPSPGSTAQEDDIIIANEVVLRIRAPSAQHTVRERAEIVTRRLVDILSYENTLDPDVRVVTKGRGAAIYVGSRLLVTVQRADAKANKTSAEALARVWAENV